ncbi:MAG: SIS domain-containing protein, partial [Thermoanaerobaculia bacterium]|nr:SIS domain-containing protein [Thermoanaerobaculia bacterium]
MLRRHLDGLVASLVAWPLAAVEQAVSVLDRARRDGAEVFVLGNGGSAASASHFACDLNKNTTVPGEPGFRVTCLCDNTAILTALANDHGYDQVFAAQIRERARPGDVVVAISTSGASENVLRAAEVGREAGATTMGWSGAGPTPLADLVDVAVEVANSDVA